MCNLSWTTHSSKEQIEEKLDICIGENESQSDGDRIHVYEREAGSVVVAKKQRAYALALAILNTLATQSHARYVCE